MGLSEKVAALVAELEAEAGTLDRRRAEMIAKRDAEIAEVRERYRADLEAIDRERGLASRLRRTLDSAEGLQGGETRPRPSRAVGESKFKPGDAVMEQVLAELASGAETALEIVSAPSVQTSRASVRNALSYGREQGWIRLAGKVRKGRQEALSWRLTPQGEEFLATRRNGHHVATP